MLDQQGMQSVVNGLSPEAFEASEQVVGQVDQMTPEMIESLKGMRGGGVYEGIPEEFYVKRLRIHLQRKREHDMYAFI